MPQFHKYIARHLIKNTQARGGETTGLEIKRLNLHRDWQVIQVREYHK